MKVVKLVASDGSTLWVRPKEVITVEAYPMGSMNAPVTGTRLHVTSHSFTLREPPEAVLKTLGWVES